MPTKPILLWNSDEYAIVDSKDYEYLMEMGNWGKMQKGYVRLKGGGQQRMHSVIAARMKEEEGRSLPDGAEVDHWNGNKLHNFRSNLRIVTSQENTRNQKRKSSNRSGYKGVEWFEQKKTWRVTLSIGRSHVYYDYFDDVEDAAQAYDIASLIFHQDFGRLNYPQRQISPRILKAVVDRLIELDRKRRCG